MIDDDDEKDEPRRFSGSDTIVALLAAPCPPLLQSLPLLHPLDLLSLLPLPCDCNSFSGDKCGKAWTSVVVVVGGSGS